MVGLGGWIGALVIGGLAGWVASMIMKTNGSMGIVLNIVVGIAGAIIGNLLLPVFGIQGTTGFSIWSFVVALVGAVVLLFIIGLFTRRRTSQRMEWAQILVILLSVLVGIFLLLGIILLVMLVKISLQIKKVTASAGQTVKAIENSVANVARFASFGGVLKTIQRIRGKKQGGKNVKR